MKKLFISQPMRGLSDSEIFDRRTIAHREAERLAGEPLELIDSLLTDCGVGPIWCLGRSICLMEKADYMYFADGWDSARGCKIEHEVAVAYGIKILGEQE